MILVIDQFRGDYLDRYRDDFKTPNGFNLFLKKGAHFTDCYYDYANLVTAAAERAGLAVAGPEPLRPQL